MGMDAKLLSLGAGGCPEPSWPFREGSLLIQLRSSFGAGVYLCLGWSDWYPEVLEEES